MVSVVNLSWLPQPGCGLRLAARRPGSGRTGSLFAGIAEKLFDESPVMA